MVSQNIQEKIWIWNMSVISVSYATIDLFDGLQTMFLNKLSGRKNHIDTSFTA